MPASDFHHFDSIARYLKIEMEHSRETKAECAAAYVQWIKTAKELGLSLEDV